MIGRNVLPNKEYPLQSNRRPTGKVIMEKLLLGRLMEGSVSRLRVVAMLGRGFFGEISGICVGLKPAYRLAVVL